MSSLPFRKWTSIEFEKAAQLGLFRSDERLELIDGLIVEKMTQNAPHFTSFRLVQRWLESIAGEGKDVRGQGPIYLDEMNLPEPDLAVVSGSPRDFSSRHPNAGEVLLLVEVSDTSLEKDRSLKGAIYAKAAIPEYWIVDVKSRRIEVLREPDAAGYKIIQILTADESIAPLFAGTETKQVSELLP